VTNEVYAFAFDGSPSFHAYWKNAEFDANHAFCKNMSYTTDPLGGFSIPYVEVSAEYTGSEVNYSVFSTGYFKWHNWCSLSSWSDWYLNYGTYESASSGSTRNTPSISVNTLSDYTGDNSAYYYLYRSYLGCTTHKPDRVYLYRYQLNFGSKDSSQNVKVLYLDSAYNPTNESWNTFCEQSFGGLYPGFFPEIPDDRDFSLRGAHFLAEYNGVGPASNNCTLTIGNRGHYVTSKCAPGQSNGIWPTVDFCYGSGETADQKAIRFNCDFNVDICKSVHSPVAVDSEVSRSTLALTPTENNEKRSEGNPTIASMSRMEYGKQHESLKNTFEESVRKIKEMQSRDLETAPAGAESLPYRENSFPFGDPTTNGGEFSRVVPPIYLDGYHTVFTSDEHSSTGALGSEIWSNSFYDGFNHFVVPGQNAFEYESYGGNNEFLAPGYLEFNNEISCFQRSTYAFSSPNFGYWTCSADRVVAVLGMALFLVFLLL
jgi:hypothetical protein